MHDDRGGVGGCGFDGCGKAAFILDTRLGTMVCLEHRQWACGSCDSVHNHRELQRYSDDDGYSLACPGTGKILLLEFWGPIASWPAGTPMSALCGPCWGKGRCQCLQAQIGEHENCLLCQGDRRCSACHGTGLAVD